MFFRLIQTPTRSPSTCALCGSGRGPFFDVTGLEHLELSTAHGIMHADGAVYVCVGTRENTGCVLQMADALGCLFPDVAAELKGKVKAYEIAAIEKDERIAELQARLIERVTA